MDGDEWEGFCERMLRHEFTWKNFVSVPHKDRGDHGIEFFTKCGVIFQCYYPDPTYSMADYKKHVQKKINEDLKKLSDYEVEIKKMLGDVLITEWVLVVPEVKSRELIKHCMKKEKSLPKLSFFSTNGVSVKIETDDSFPSGSLYSRTFIGEEINIPLEDVETADAEAWKQSNSSFYDNICRKTLKVSKNGIENLRTELIKNYLRLEELMDAYRDQFPDLHTEVNNIALANLQTLKNDNLFDQQEPRQVLSSLLKLNRETISKIEQRISPQNNEAFSSGFIARWLAECKMDFIINE